MSDDVTAPPEPEEIDEKVSTDLRILTTNAGDGDPDGDHA
jgi:hypothetical protein